MKISRIILLLAAGLLAPFFSLADDRAISSPVVTSSATVTTEEKVDFATQVKPIFDYYCYECHGNGRSKGGVRLDVKTNAMAHIMAGDSRRSDVYRAVTRNIGASDRMPPVTREQPYAEEIAVIRQWIEQGADWLPPASTQQKVTYAKDIRPILAASCFNCHGETTQRHALRLDSLEALVKGSEDGPVIFPGKSDQGDLILQVTGLGAHDMPPRPSAPPLLSHERAVSVAPEIGPDGLRTPKPLTIEQIGLIRAWAAQGAR